MTELKCRNCGAPLRQDGKCEYCGSVFYYDFDFIVYGDDRIFVRPNPFTLSLMESSACSYMMVSSACCYIDEEGRVRSG